MRARRRRLSHAQAEPAHRFVRRGPFLGSALAAPPAAAQRVEVGNAATVVGDVKLSNAQIRNPRKIERRQRLAWGDQIDTGKRSQLQILLLDRSTFGIGASSRVRIDRFVYDPNAGRSVVATFFKGALRFFSGRQEGENQRRYRRPPRGASAFAAPRSTCWSAKRPRRSPGTRTSSTMPATSTATRTKPRW